MSEITVRKSYHKITAWLRTYGHLLAHFKGESLGNLAAQSPLEAFPERAV